MDALNLRQLHALVVVSEELHFGRAAVRLGVSQPSLSQLVRRIEDAVGAELFQRRPEVCLTEAGALFLPEVVEALATLRRASVAVEELSTGAAGQLTIRFTSSALVSPFPTIVREFRRRFPRIRIDLQKSSSGAIGSELGADEIGVMRTPPSARPERYTSLVDEPFVLVLPPEHELLTHHTIPMAALAGVPCVHFPRKESPALHHEIDRACLAAGFAPNVVLEATEWLTILGFVRSGLGVAFVPATYQTLRWGGVEYRALGPGGPTSSVGISWRAQSRAPAVKHFMRVVQELNAHSV